MFHRRPKLPRRRTRSLGIEQLESRCLMSASAAPQVLRPFAALPNETAVNNPDFSKLWWIQNTGQNGGVSGADIHVNNAWDITTGSRDVIVAVLDTGIQLDHPDLAANIWTNPNEIAGDGIDNDNNGFIDDIHGWNFVDGNNDPDDTSALGHGTMVAGVLGAVGDNGIGITGVAQKITLLPVKIGGDGGVTSEAVTAGINYVIKLKKMGFNIVAINASYLGFSGFGSGELTAIKNAGTNGILYVSAAGNNSMNLDSLFYSFIKQPNQIVVAATDRDDHLWEDSSYGASSVELAAPGAEITSTWNKLNLYITSSGTSFAGPMVSGAVALLKTAMPSATAAQIRSAIMSSVDVLPSLQGKVMSNGRLNIERALQKLVNANRFSGEIEAVTPATIKGWAYDTQIGPDPVPLKVVVDGVEQPIAYADVPRNDLNLPSPDHGFLITLPPLSPGSHTIKIYATGDNGGEKLLGTRTVVAKAPVGKLEQATGTLLKGYAYDPDAKADSVNVRIDIDGVEYDTILADASRPDLKSTGSLTHGYSVPLTGIAVGFHRVEVFALDAQTGVATLIGTKTIMVNSAPQAVIEAFTVDTLSGYAWDPDSGVDPTRLRVNIDSMPPIFITAGDSRPDIVGAVGSEFHGFDVALPALMPGSHTIKIYTIDDQTGVAALVQRKTFSVKHAVDNRIPAAKVESFKFPTLKGYTYDADDTAAALTIRIDIDGVAGTPFLANEYRASLKSKGGGNHGFSYDLSALANGPHQIDIYTYDAATATPVLFYSKMLTVGPAAGAKNTGALTTFTKDQIAGWAFAPYLGSAAANIRIDVDKLIGLVIPADETLPDLLATLGSTDHGFTAAAPTVSAGSHRVAVYIIDPLTSAATLIGAKTFTFS